jgi:methylmalonyl-CoA mutase N-terminal domain/subunit
MVKAIEQSYPQREIADASFREAARIDSGEQVVIGLNKHVGDDSAPIELHKVDSTVERKQIERLQATRATRDGRRADEALGRLRASAAGEGNVMEPLLDCARADCSEGEIVQSLQRVFGSYTETPVF